MTTPGPAATFIPDTLAEGVRATLGRLGITIAHHGAAIARAASDRAAPSLAREEVIPALRAAAEALGQLDAQCDVAYPCARARLATVAAVRYTTGLEHARAARGLTGPQPLGRSTVDFGVFAVDLAEARAQRDHARRLIEAHGDEDGHLGGIEALLDVLLELGEPARSIHRAPSATPAPTT